MQRHVYHLEVHFVSTASRGKAAPEVTKEKGLYMVRETLRKTDVPEEVRLLLLGWLAGKPGGPELPESSLVRVSVRERSETSEPQGLLIHLAKVSYLGTVHMEVMAKRLVLPDNLVGLAALAVAKQLKSKEEVGRLGLPRSLWGEVSKLIGGITCENTSEACQ